MNILLTGSGGFIGRNLKEKIATDYTLFMPRSAELDLLNQKDVSKYVRDNSINLIAHSAANGVRITPDASMEEVAEKNIVMFENLAALVSDDCRMISLGSGAEYDKHRDLHKVKESEFGQSIPKDPYGYSKYIIAKRILEMENVLDLCVFGVYGKYEDFSRITTYMAQQILNKAPITINRNVVFDFIYIDDLCEIIRRFIKKFPMHKRINATPIKSISLEKLAETANLITDTKSEIIIKNPDLNYEYTGSNDLLLTELADFSFTDYDDGMQQLYNYLKK